MNEIRPSGSHKTCWRVANKDGETCNPNVQHDGTACLQHLVPAGPSLIDSLT